MFLFKIVLFLCIPLVLGLVEKLKIEKDDRKAFHIEMFGFEENGILNASVSQLALFTRSHLNTTALEKIRFIVAKSESEEGVRFLNNECIDNQIENAESFNVFEQGASQCTNPTTVCFFSFTKTIKEPGYYHLYFSNCVPEAELVSFELTLEEYNVDANGNRNYLSTGETSVPHWLMFFCLAFCGQAVAWIYVLIKQRENVKSIHWIMGVVLILKILDLLLDAAHYHSLRTTGLHDGWSIAYYIISFIKGMTMFATIVLIGTGWSYLKPFLTDRDKHVMLAVLMVQFMVNVAIVVMDETSPGSVDWLSWRDLFHLLDLACCCVILIPIVSSLQHLKNAAKTDDKVQRNVTRLQSFRTFYLAVISYLYFTRIIIFLLVALLPFEWTWISTAFREVASFAFYLMTGYLFRPQPANPYLPIEQDSGRDNDIELSTIPSAVNERQLNARTHHDK